jgi:hypothetical protein
MKTILQSQVFTLVVDLDERGSFKAHVDDVNGKEVFSFSNEGENGWPDEDGLWIVNDGFMKHGRDTDGLLNYLQSIGIAKANDTLVLEN